MKRKRALALTLALVMALSLCACGKKEEKPADPGASVSDASQSSSLDIPKEPDYTGRYISVQGEMMGMTMSGDDMAGFDIELKAGGEGTISIDGDVSPITWKVSGRKITITIEGEDFAGDIDDDIIKIDDMLGLGLNLTFAKEGTPAANPERWIPEERKKLIGIWTSYKVLDIMEDDASDKYDPAGMVLDIRADSTVSCYWEGRDLGDQEWDFFGGSAFLDSGVSFKFDDDQKELIVDFSDHDICDDYLTYYCQKGGEAPSGNGESATLAAPASDNGKYGKSVEEADGIVPAARIMEAAMIVRGGFKANHFFSYEEICELMGGVHGKPTFDVGWDEETRSHRYEWYPDNDPGDFFSAQFTVVDGEEIGKTYQYPGDVSDTEGTPYEKQPAADAAGKSRADADGIASKDGFKAFIQQRMEQEEKKQGKEMSYEQIATLCGCDGQPAYTDNWKADKHSYRWKVDDDIYFVADFAVLSTGTEIMTGGNGASNLEEKLGLK